MRIHHTIPAPTDRPPYHEWAKQMKVGRRHDKANRTYIRLGAHSKGAQKW